MNKMDETVQAECKSLPDLFDVDAADLFGQMMEMRITARLWPCRSWDEG